MSWLSFISVIDRVVQRWKQRKSAQIDIPASQPVNINTRAWLADKFPDVKLKTGVSISALNIEHMAPVIAEAQRQYQARGVPCVITSGNDGAHRHDSLHYSGDALDFRTRTLDDPQALTVSMREHLGDDYDVILKHDPPHLHVEYDPHV